MLVEKRKLFYVILKQFLLVYNTWNPVHSGQLSKPATNYPPGYLIIAKGYSVGYPLKIILVLTQELAEITALVTEFVQLKAFNGAVVSDDNNLSNLNVEKTKLLQKILVYVVSIICSFVDPSPNVYGRAQVYTNTVEFSLPCGDAYTTNPSSSGKDHVSATGHHWHQKAIVLVTEAGGLTWLVSKAEKDADRRVPRKQKAKRETGQVIMDYEQMIIPGPTYQSRIQGPKPVSVEKQVSMEKHMANLDNFEFPVTEATMMVTPGNLVTFGGNERSIPSFGFGNGFLPVELEVQRASGRVLPTLGSRSCKYDLWTYEPSILSSFSLIHMFFYHMEQLYLDLLMFME
ncbi:hypothetical protein GIB67_039958 [Kingdonia uniflora]|uniref:Uncharacterized protein n=1 Tax=Kingdonia uniflora TaxID=39325 RepID=A0A7J7P3H7_9MAGN|nr:hypothetical protein GIB67_039958 [Kingdonia uniflora]